MKKILLLLTLFTAVTLTAQSARDKEVKKQHKQIDKAIKVFTKKSYTKGIEKLNKYMEKMNNPIIRTWDVLVDMEYIRYEYNLENDGVFTSVMLDDDGDTIEVTDEMIWLYEMFPTRYRVIKICREATNYSESPNADEYLRFLEIEVGEDSAVSEKAKIYFEEGEEFFEKEDYEMAIMNYKKAIKEDSAYYAANIALGLSFYRDNENADSAIYYFTQAKEIQPHFLKPRKFIIEVLVKEGLYFRAKKECLDALCVYPGFDLKDYYQEILYVENKYMDEHRLWRSFYPNNFSDKNQQSFSGPFKAYRDAKDDISKYCNEDGIIEPNGVTNDKHLEVYSWHVLLESFDGEVPSYLEFAEEMEEEGYLDCYVMVSLFHYDIYPQFKDFMSYEENRTRTKEYIEKFLIKTYED